MALRSQFIATVMGAVLSLGIGCASPPKDGGRGPVYTRAEVTVYPRVDGPATEQKIIVEDPAEINRLTSHFPGMGKGRWSWKMGSWRPRVSINFLKSDGTVVTVRSDYEDWTEGEGRGDFRVKGDLAADLASLLEGTRER